MSSNPEIHRLGDLCTGHGPCAPRPNAEGSPDVLCNGIPIHRMGDGWTIHCNHGGVLVSGSKTVKINGLDCARIGDPVSCGSACQQHSPDVHAGG